MNDDGRRRVAEVLTLSGRPCHVMDHSDDAPAAPEPMCITAEALRTLLFDIGDHEPECGAFLFGPVWGAGTDVAEKDFAGSRSGGTTFVPDAAWATDRLQYHVRQPGADQRLLTGICHSHPLGAEHLSPKTAPGVGDLGYAEAVFAAVPHIRFLAMPVFTNTGPGRVPELHPWYVARDDPATALAARLRVCSPAEFPARRFNPDVEDPIVDWRSVACPVDLDRLARYVGGTARLGPPARGWITIEIEIRRGGVRLSIGLSPEFPAREPEVLVVTSPDRLVAAPFRWKEATGRDVTRRLADLCHSIAYLARTRF